MQLFNDWTGEAPPSVNQDGERLPVESDIGQVDHILRVT